MIEIEVSKKCVWNKKGNKALLHQFRSDIRILKSTSVDIFSFSQHSFPCQRKSFSSSFSICCCCVNVNKYRMWWMLMLPSSVWPSSWGNHFPICSCVYKIVRNIYQPHSWENGKEKELLHILTIFDSDLTFFSRSLAQFVSRRPVDRAVWNLSGFSCLEKEETIFFGFLNEDWNDAPSRIENNRRISFCGSLMGSRGVLSWKEGGDFHANLDCHQKTEWKFLKKDFSGFLFLGDGLEAQQDVVGERKST